MKTITIKTTKTTEEEQKINLPYYSIGKAFAYCLFHEQIAICVEYGIHDTGIVLTKHINPVFADYQKPCTAQEFWQKYFEIQTANEKIINELHDDFTKLL